MKLIHKRDIFDYTCEFYPYFEEYGYHDYEHNNDDDFILLDRRDGIICAKSFGKVIHDNTIARAIMEIRQTDYRAPREYYYQIILPELVATDTGGWGGLYQNIAHTDVPLEGDELERLLNNQGWYFLDTI